VKLVYSATLTDLRFLEVFYWGLSPSEAEVAQLLIKGLSMREISQAREVKEETIRQQATPAYAKSGYAGRHEIAAHFIEDFMSEDLLAAWLHIATDNSMAADEYLDRVHDVCAPY